MPSPLRGLFSAYSAVALFFVLSGYVQHLSFRSKGLHWCNLGAFTHKRVFRRYPLHLVALLLAAVVVFLLPLKDCAMLMHAEYARETLTHDHHECEPVAAPSLADQRWDGHDIHQSADLDAGGGDAHLAAVSADRVRGRADRYFHLGYPHGAELSAGSVGGEQDHRHGGHDPLVLFRRVYGAADGRAARTATRRSGVWVMVTGLVIYSAAAWIGRGLLGKEAPLYVAGLGSALMIAAMVRHPRLARPFSTPFLVRLGQLSYGIYLLHFPLLLAVTWDVERAGASGQMIPCCLVL